MQVTVARQVDEATRELIAGKLCGAWQKSDPTLPGRCRYPGRPRGTYRGHDLRWIGRRRMEGLRRQMLAADLPTDSGEAATA